MAGGKSKQRAPSSWAPLASPVFRALWIAQFVSNLGTWMQTVGAQWMLVENPAAEVLVPLVQTATTLPIMLLALPSGVVADLVDRRRLLLTTQSVMAAAVATLAALTAAQLTTPTVLLTLLFLIGCGQALTAPAWQAIQPELVPREQIPAAAALTSMALNAARAVGPAIAGVLVAISGPTLVFTLNAVSFAGIVVVLLVWKRSPTEQALAAERPLAALQAGRRFVRSSPVVRRILFRAALFILPASALWGLLPVVASNELGLSSSGYGLMLGALGLGAVLGAVTLSAWQSAFRQNTLLGVAAVGFAAATAIAALVPNVVVVLLGLVVGGMAWLLALSTLNASMQLSLPGWVRARGLSVYLLIFMGGQALGSMLWGLVAGSTTTVIAMLISAGLLVAAGLSAWWWPLHPQTGQLDVAPSAHWPEPALVFEPEPRDGPVLVLSTYRVAAEDEAAFLTAMQRLARSRQRTGATLWRLFRSGEQEQTFVEAFAVRSWDEHLRQHHTRLTAVDHLVEQEVRRYVQGEPIVQHLIGVNPHQP
ncbi:MFS transporter [Mycolicibacterium thermoresistibile]